MSNFNYQILHLEQHKNFAFKPANDFNFAKQMAFVPIVIAEIYKIAMELPIFFIESNSNENNAESEIDKDYNLITLLSIQNDLNIMVNHLGKWVGQYIPAKLRGFPFMLGKVSQKDSNNNVVNSLALCIENSYLIPPEIVETNANFKENLIFDENQSLSEKIKKTLDFLQQTEISNQQTSAAIQILKKHNLIVPFTHQSLKLSGLFCVDEKRLNELSAEALKELQNCGALFLCYSQILSQQNIDKLVYLTNLLLSQQAQAKKLQAQQEQLLQQQNNQQASPKIETNTADFFKGDTINFEGLFK